MSATARSPGPALVATKLYVPELKQGLVARADLVARLVAGGDRKLTLLCAPAGWGKTIVLSEWHASPEERRPFAWVSLDPGDDDPVRFWSYLIGALRTVEPELGSTALEALPNAGPDLAEVVLPPLLNDLEALSRPLVLVLDDYHFVRHEPIHASVSYLLRHLPRTIQVAIASRADPPLPLGSMRAAGEVTEIRAAELRFRDREADALLNGTLGLDLDAADVELLQARTEGWAAGLQLAALSLRAQADKHAFLESFSGDDRQISDYLHEVMAGQRPLLRDFLLRTSILDRFCSSLCDSVVGGGDAHSLLEEVDRSNLFLIPLDTHGDWYRYHHLFRDLLRHELAHAHSEQIPELHRRAAAWHLAAGNVEEAVEHSTAAGDLVGAAQLIARQWRPFFNLGRTETVARWIDALPREHVLADARLCLARGFAALFLGRLEEVDGWREAGERAPLPAPLQDGSASVEENAALLQAANAYLSGDVQRANEVSRRGIALGLDSPFTAVIQVNMGPTLYFAGRLDEAAAVVEAGLRRLSGKEWSAAIVTGLGLLALVYTDRGELGRADSTVSEAQRRIDEFGLAEAPWTTLVSAARGKLLEKRGELAEAEAAFERAVVLARRGGRRLDLAHGLLRTAGVRRARRDHAGGRSAAREARQALAACPDPGILDELLATTERLLQMTPPARAAGLPADPDLSERELTVLRLLGSELSQREIGSELYVSFNTVKAHTRSIFRKLGVSTRAEAVARGRELGLL